MSEIVASHIWASYGLELSSLTILFYDYIIMLPDEIQHMWFGSNRNSIGSWIFFLTRYTALAAHIPSALAQYGKNLGPSVCSKLQNVHFYVTALLQLYTAIMFILRVNALYWNRLVLGVLMALTLGAIGIAIWSLALPHPGEGPTEYVFAVPGCNPLIKQKEAIRLAITWGAVSVFDFVVFALTFKKALEGHWRNPSALWYVFMRDGTMYFIVIFICNAGNILTFLLAPPVLKGANGLMTNVMSATLVCRLIINLRVTDARTQRRRSVETELVVVTSSSVMRQDDALDTTPSSRCYYQPNDSAPFSQYAVQASPRPKTLGGIYR